MSSVTSKVGRGDKTVQIDNTFSLRNHELSSKKRRKIRDEREESEEQFDYREDEEEYRDEEEENNEYEYEDDPEDGEEDEDMAGGEKLLFSTPTSREDNSTTMRNPRSATSSSSSNSSIWNKSTKVSTSKSRKIKESRAIAYWKERCMEAEQKNKLATMRDRCELYTDEENQNACTRMQIQLMVKNIVFPKQKFIDMNELRDITTKNSLPNRIMDRMLIPEEKRYDTWNEYGILVKKHLDKVRCSRTTTMKDDFIANGKYIFN